LVRRSRGLLIVQERTVISQERTVISQERARAVLVLVRIGAGILAKP